MRARQSQQRTLSAIVTAPCCACHAATRRLTARAARRDSEAVRRAADEAAKTAAQRARADKAAEEAAVRARAQRRRAQALTHPRWNTRGTQMLSALLKESEKDVFKLERKLEEAEKAFVSYQITAERQIELMDKAMKKAGVTL